MTAPSATAAGATSAIPLRIDTFIKSKLNEARSDGFSGLRSSAEDARSHGFTACANSRYADFLAAMSAHPDQVSYYTEKYPACFFLPWKALNATLTALNLWCDLPRHYTGAIPPGQLPYLDIFSLDPSDTVPAPEMLELLDDGKLNRVMWSFLLDRSVQHSPWMRYDDDKYLSVSSTYALMLQWNKLPETKQKTLQTAIQDFRSSWFVIAPPQAFNVTEDWRSRTRKLLLDAQTIQQPAPDDPLVVRFVRHGCLVVAAWGEEAAELNATVNALNL